MTKPPDTFDGHPLRGAEHGVLTKRERNIKEKKEVHG